MPANDSARDPDDLDALRAASDILGIDALLTAEERAVRDRVRAFVDAEIRPHIADWFDRAVFPADLVPELGRLGVLGMTIEGHGCPGASAVDYGLAALENSPIRHAANLESVRTYEGTDEVHTLLLGQHLTGIAGFR
ncbi:alkylation response protein AidB-like acyl-CoA dehydrogenase [Microbacterium immunditiarum]|uniref:Alkylation response protein AidB-like acyl-CoA dehydrogenase n=1 Tax=Microbacterium immunditiarum TaxID=337480 RepID=A0A7Y9KI88_9MICO|nr:alkylation response protein AidB-like acyl-CoA dehydrogenase [Microbacterium immunditiarum]